MKIAIASTGRFHVCDLARELSFLGHEVCFYSLVPPWRTRLFGLPRECNKWLLPNMIFSALLYRFARNQDVKRARLHRLNVAFDRCVARSIQACDVLIAISGLCNESSKMARERFGCQVWIERGSRHVLSQREIIRLIPKADQVCELAVKRELTDYEQADRIVVLSKHCEDSFLDHGTAKAKLFRNPLGVDLKVFQPTKVPQGPPTIIMTGTWSLRKGCDILVNAWRKIPGSLLIHVGTVGDCPLPTDKNFFHYEKVEQSKLVDFYARSHIFALASREEGLATVQPQALACGLRLVCTDRTGGEDLIQFVCEPNVISVVPSCDVDAFARSMQNSLDLATKESGLRNRLTSETRDKLSWEGYGRRYSEELKKSIIVRKS